MKVLILGRSGQLAQALMAARPDGVGAEAWGRDQLDLADSGSILPAIRAYAPTIVINASAYTAVDRAESEPEAAFRLNRDAVRELGQACALSDSALIHVSTDFVFDGQQSRGYRPDDPCNPLGIYGRSKREGELALLEAKPDATIVRTAWVYSAEGQNFMRTMLRLMAERDELSVVCDQVGTPTSAGNLARVLWQLADQGPPPGAWHYTDSGVASWYDFACAIRDEAQRTALLDRDVRVYPIPTVDYPTPAERPAFSVLDCTATWRLLGRPAEHWQQALRRELKLLQKKEINA